VLSTKETIPNFVLQTETGKKVAAKSLALYAQSAYFILQANQTNPICAHYDGLQQHEIAFRENGKTWD